jgi:ribosome maturation factor RimP
MDKEIQKIVESFGATLYAIENVPTGEDGHIFRVLIQKKDTGVDLDLCSSISTVVSAFLDTTPPIKGHYYLEVSSPGIERALKRVEHFEKSIGENVKVSLKDGTKLRGELLAVEGEMLTIKGDEVVKISFGDLSKARTYFEWK